MAALVSSLRADVTIDLQVGPLSGVTAATGILVADTNDDGFANPGPWIAGQTIEAGSFLGSTDELIVAVFENNDAAPWPSDTGFAEIITGIDMDKLCQELRISVEKELDPDAFIHFFMWHDMNLFPDSSWQMGYVEASRQRRRIAARFCERTGM